MARKPKERKKILKHNLKDKNKRRKKK